MRELRVTISGEGAKACDGCGYAKECPGGWVCKLFLCDLMTSETPTGQLVRCNPCQAAEIEPAAPRLVELLDTAIGRIEDYVHETKMPFPHEPKGRITIATDDVERLAVFVMRAIQGIHAVDAAEVHIAGRAPVDGPQRPRAFAIIESLARITERWDEVAELREAMEAAVSRITKVKVGYVDLGDVNNAVGMWNELQVNLKETYADLVAARKELEGTVAAPRALVDTFAQLVRIVDPCARAFDPSNILDGELDSIVDTVRNLVDAMTQIAQSIDPEVDDYEDVGKRHVRRACKLAPRLKRERKRTATLLDILVDLRGQK